MVKRTAQILQSFGTELAETELPNDIQATSNLLGTHINKKSKMKEDLLVALGQGSRLLESINEPVVRDPDHNMNQDELENLATVQRLLSQLNETERAFDEFWERHKTKLEQCLLLRHFEHNYREVRCLLDQVAERLTAFSEVGISPAHADHIFRELSSHEERVCEVLDRAQALAREGDELIQNTHYAEDSIQPKCIELRAVNEELSTYLRAKKDHLLRAIELHHSLERAAKWCDDGIYLLASQPVDKCQSHDGAESALQEIERYLDTAGQNKLTDPSAICRDYETVLNLEFRDQVEKVFQKQVSMQEMFEKRRVSLKKLAAKHTRPVQPVAPRPEAIKSPLSSPAKRVLEKSCSEGDSVNRVSCRKVEGQLQSNRSASMSEEDENLAILRKHVMNELLETERAYVEELLCVLQGYASEMDNPAMASLMPIPLQNKKDVLFGNMPEIYHFHKRTFLRELEEYEDCPELVGRCFLERMTDLQIYEKYCQNKPRSESLWRQCSDCSFFQVHTIYTPLLRYTPYTHLPKVHTTIHTSPKSMCGGYRLVEVIFSDRPVSSSCLLSPFRRGERSMKEKKGEPSSPDANSCSFPKTKGEQRVREGRRILPYNIKNAQTPPPFNWMTNLSPLFPPFADVVTSLSISHIFLSSLHFPSLHPFLLLCLPHLSLSLSSLSSHSPLPPSFSPLLRSFSWPRRSSDQSYLRQSSSYYYYYRIKHGMLPSTDLSPPDNKSLTLPRIPFSPSGSPTSPGHKTKRHEIKSDPTPFGFQGWTKGSLSLDANEENDGYSSPEEPLNSDPEDEEGKKLCAGKYTVVSDYEKGEGQDLSVKSGETVQLIKEGDEGQWFVKNLKTKQEGWVAAANILTLIGESKSCQSLTSSEGSGSGNLSTSSSCCETYTSFSDIKP
ncbi:unnamed protein product [Oncorhynchus mykiss]|uniref:SH3 domain-containing protein n=1 Tax=Oncorhynchus mykiss TaxID=8022 RepID=A0A060W6M8_ONCMY|nr:unnamed protein product [Oncorhynchus mykiss]